MKDSKRHSKIKDFTILQDNQFEQLLKWAQPMLELSVSKKNEHSKLVEPIT